MFFAGYLQQLSYFFLRKGGRRRKNHFNRKGTGEEEETGSADRTGATASPRSTLQGSCVGLFVKVHDVNAQQRGLPIPPLPVFLLLDFGFVTGSTTSRPQYDLFLCALVLLVPVRRVVLLLQLLGQVVAVLRVKQ